MKTTMKTQENRPELSFDGFGINGPDEYRTRLCTFSKGTSEDDRKKYGALFEAAPELLAACREAAGCIGLELHPSDARKIQGIIQAAISKAEGK